MCSRAPVMSLAWESHHPGCRRRRKILLGCVIVELLDASNWQQDSGNGDICGKTRCFSALLLSSPGRFRGVCSGAGGGDWIYLLQTLRIKPVLARGSNWISAGQRESHVTQQEKFV